MVRVLVLGATGYIGSATCAALRRHSHIVYGLARTPEKAQELAKNEVIPVLGTIEDGSYLETVESANIDCVIDAAQALLESRKVLEALKKIGSDRISRRGMHSPKLGFVYTSGTWVHGSSTDRLNDLNPAGIEDDPGCPAESPKLVSWRPALEDAVIEAKDVLDTLVVRPALVYGRGSQFPWSLWFKTLQKVANEKAGSVELQCNEDAIASLVHVDEVASALVAAVEQVSIIASGSTYPIFDVVSSREPLKLILDGVARAMGFTGEVRLVRPTDTVFEALSTTGRLDSTRLRDLLGWESKRLFGMLDEIELFTAGWQAVSGHVKVQ